MTLTRRDLLLAALLGLAVTLVTCAASPRQGIHRDEAYYMKAGERYEAYWEDLLRGKLERPFSQASIDRYWGYNHEHPPLFKVLYGTSWRLIRSVLPERTAFRLPTMIAFGLLVALVFLWSVELTASRWGALAAALLMAAQPRAFFHAQTASFDLPAATLWFGTTYLYWRALPDRGWKSAVLVGVAYGLFLATKLQSFFLPFALGLHWLGLGILRRRAGQPWPSWLIPASMATIAPLLFLALWPWLWHDTVPRFGDYLKFHWTHVHYNFEYLGRNWNEPPYPWHEPLGMLLFTAPVMLLVLAPIGAFLFPRDTSGRASRLLLLVAALLPISLFLRGTVPIFGETKHWLGTMPFLAVAAGCAVGRLVDRLRLELPRWPRALAAATVLTVFAPAAVETARSHPYGLSHYNALAGGAPGGADLGMNRQFWGYSVQGLLPWLNAQLRPNAKLYLHDWNHDAYEMYLRDGLLRKDIRDAGMELPGMRAADAALVIHELHFDKYDYMIWSVYGHLQPTAVLTLDGVPLVSVYLKKP